MAEEFPIVNDFYDPNARVEYLERQVRWLQEKLEETETELQRALWRIADLESGQVPFDDQMEAEPPQEFKINI